MPVRLPVESSRTRITPELAPGVAAGIAGIGRTEDVALSPAGGLVALAEFTQNRIYLFPIDIDRSGAMLRVALSACLTIESAALRQPHGVCFLDERHLLVCNRGGDLCVFRIPDAKGVVSRETVAPAAVISGQGWLRAKVKSPGSAACHRLPDGRHRVLVCNNHWNFISSHELELGDRIRVAHGGQMTDAGIRIPDGISVSPDGAWFVISDHVAGEVQVFRNDGELGRRGDPAAVLTGLVCPHGLCFAGNDTVLVADAASPFLHVYRRRGSAWSGRLESDRTIRMLDHDTFFDGRYDPREGGIKGVAVDASARLLVTTQRLDPIAFYDLDRLLECSEPVPGELQAALRSERDQSFVGSGGTRLTQRWTFGQRLRQEVREKRLALRRLRVDWQIGRQVASLAFRSRFSKRSILDPAGPVVSLTTHGPRLPRAHYTLESIARGTLRPSRVVLWISERESFEHLPAALRRLEARGLEIRLCEDFGPHTKYFPCLESPELSGQPLVTADDDVIYPPGWLADLAGAHAAAPDRIHCHRVRRMQLSGSELAPYGAWPLGADRSPSPRNFITGVGGAIYPPAFLRFLAQAGRGFQQSCPRSDDVWLTVNAIRAGVAVCQVRDHPLALLEVPGTQAKRLFDENVRDGGNQIQLRRTFTREDLDVLRRIS